MKISLSSGVEIGHQSKPFIIAEIGSNWSNLQDCIFSIRQAQDCGASAIKFQLFTHKDLYGLEKSSQNSHELPKEWLPKLKEVCDEVGIEFMCTAFSPKGYEIIDPFVNIHKIASAEMNHIRILETVSRLNKPVILSTGAHNLEDVQEALTYLDRSKVVLMYCVASYPARQTFLESINLLRETFNVPVGYSDHSLDAVTLPRIARAHGACALEKHVNFVGTDSPDSPHSVNLMEFREMIRYLERPKNDFSPNHEEREMITTHNRRLMAIVDIKPGDLFVEGLNFGIYRAKSPQENSLPPRFINEVAGKRSKSKINCFQAITLKDI